MHPSQKSITIIAGCMPNFNQPSTILFSALPKSGVHESVLIPYHTVFYWTNFIVLLQAFSLLLPRYLWIRLECRLTTTGVWELRSPVITSEEKAKNFERLVKYFNEAKENPNRLPTCSFLYEFLNIVVVVGQLYFKNWLFGGNWHGSDFYFLDY